jgi:hypothetical protein
VVLYAAVKQLHRLTERLEKSPTVTDSHF